ITSRSWLRPAHDQRRVSELHSQAELDLSRCSGDAADLAGVIVQVAAGQAIIHTIEGIVKLRPELQAGTLGQAETLLQNHVQSGASRSNQNAATGIADKRAVRRPRR